MKIAVFDVDDTLIIHGKDSNSYYTGNVDSDLRDTLDKKNYEKIYLYTNGTWGHGHSVSQHLNINDKVSFIYGRDNLQPLLRPYHMKPNIESFEYVHRSIEYDSGSTNNEIYFFDDLKDNLETAKSLGWITILIKPNGIKEHYIDYVFPNIYSALLLLH